jgi:hypothetical protein
MKKNYLAVYDYGSGGVWMFIAARSKTEINTLYPQLTVVDVWPDWLTGEQLENVCKDFSFDIDKPPTGILRELAIQKQ